MAVKTESKEINGNNYSVKQWDATRAMVMKIKIAKYLGGILGIISEGNGSIEEKLMKNIGNMFDGVNEVELIEFIKEIACSASRNGTKMNKALFDSYFTEGLMEPYELAFFVIKVNYEDFLASILSFSTGK